MKILQKIYFVLLMTTFSSVYGGDCFKDKDINDCLEKAEPSFFTKGDAKAQYNLGLMYYNGQGVVQDYKEAVKWYRQSAEQEYVDAQYNLGWMYDEGKGVIQDYKEAVKWYRRSAEQGDGFAQYNLALNYENGKGVLQDYKEAVKWYRKSAEQGYVEAQYNLGVLYRDVLQDYKESVRWFRLAAEQGFVQAQYNLGVMYYKGQGVPQDYVMAHMYFNIGSVSGRKDAIHGRGIVETVMTSSQLEKAQDLAREWMRTHQ
jgi:uncharacterized protein